MNVGKNGVMVDLLQYSNDTLFVGEDSPRNVLDLNCMLRCYELASGLKVNFSKSSFGGGGC